MQEEKKNKKLIMDALAKVTKELRGDSSLSKFSSENDFSTSIISTIERSLKDPQLTTIFKLSEAFNMKPHALIKLIEKELPKNFSLIEK